MRTARYALSLIPAGLAWLAHGGSIACDRANVLFWALAHAIRGR